MLSDSFGTALWTEGGDSPRPGEPVLVQPGTTLILANNPSPWTFEGTNSWLLSSVGQSILVDPGPDDSQHQRAIAAALQREGLTLQHVVVSHGHADHSGGAKALAALTLSRQLTSLQDCKDGALLSFGGDSTEHLVVYQTPGHSSDGVSLLWPRKKVALVGDTAMARVNPYVDHPDGTIADALASMRKLATLVDDSWLMLPGHGPAITWPRTHLLRRLEARMRRIAQVRDLDANGLNAEEIVESIYAGLGGETRMAAAATVRAILLYIAASSPH